MQFHSRPRGRGRYGGCADGADGIVNADGTAVAVRGRYGGCAEGMVAVWVTLGKSGTCHLRVGFAKICLNITKK